MIISITVPCANNTFHPITLDISDWENWIIVDSPCIQQYGKMFGLMQPCAEYVKNRDHNLNGLVISTMQHKQYRNKETLQILEHILKTEFIPDTLEITAKTIELFKEAGLPILYEIITSDIDTQADFYAAKTILKMSQKKTISIPPKMKIISQIILLQYQPAPIKLKTLLDTVVEEKIYEAAHAILKHIQNRGTTNTICINTILELGTPDLDTIKQYLHQDKQYLREAAILILEHAEPDDLLEIAFETVFKNCISSTIASRIIQNKATIQHQDKILHILKHSESFIPIRCAVKALINICGEQATPILLQEIKDNPAMPNWKKQTFYGAIIQINQKQYQQQPLKLLQDIQPQTNDIDLLIDAIMYDDEISTNTRNIITNAIIQHLKENPPTEYDPTTIAKIIRKYPITNK